MTYHEKNHSYHHRVSDVLCVGAVLDELFHGNEAIPVEVHGLEDALHMGVAFPVMRAVITNTHKIVNGVRHLKK